MSWKTSVELEFTSPITLIICGLLKTYISSSCSKINSFAVLLSGDRSPTILPIYLSEAEYVIGQILNIDGGKSL